MIAARLLGIIMLYSIIRLCIILCVDFLNRESELARELAVRAPPVGLPEHGEVIRALFVVNARPAKSVVTARDLLGM